MGPKLKFGNGHIRLPRYKIARITLGILLIIGSIFWFLPVLGLWMFPLGVMVLAVDIPMIKRSQFKFLRWWRDRKKDAPGKAS
jgi:hypothetical protein